MSLLFVAFIAGVLTVLAPCTLPILPIIIGGSVGKEHDRLRPFIITGSLALSIILFTLLLKVSTLFIDVPQQTWSIVSGIIIILMGIITVFPHIWELFALKLNLSQKSNKILSEASHQKSYWRDILVGASLGPVFSSCSPTYFLILATILPQSLASGILHLIVYSLGLGLVLLLIAFLGQKFVAKIRWAADPKGWFKKGIGVLFILVGVFILTGADKKLQTYILEKGFFDITKVEQILLERMDE